GDEGLALTRDVDYDLIFLDHMMPGKDGIATLHEMRADEQSHNLRTPAICLTANAISGAREQYIREGFEDYLTKPIESEQLEELLLKMLPKEKVQIRETEEEADAEGGQPDGGKADIAKLMGEYPGLFGIEQIDVKKALAGIGSTEVYLSLVRMFYENVVEKTSELDGYLKRSDLKSYTIKVHALKSSARTVGAMELGRKAQLLEDAGKKEDADYIRAHHGEMTDEYGQIALLLKEAISKESSGDEDAAKEKADASKPEAGEALMQSFYDRIRSAADEMDGDLLDEIFGEIDAYRLAKEDADCVGKIRSAAAQFDFDRILEELS
ncbi:MAG: response regulator, partial [Lachnospiraceae bacterium]|nr:response regulator [Lachnospiraceae bacterium]